MTSASMISANKTSANKISGSKEEIKEEMTRVLEPHGFRRSGVRFRNTQIAEVVREVVIEKFRWNTPGTHGFRLLIRLYLATGVVGEHTFPRLAGHYTKVMDFGDGALRGEENAFHAMPADPADAQFLLHLRDLVERDVVPFLQAAKSVEAVVSLANDLSRRLGREQFVLGLAIAFARLGRTAESREFFVRVPGDKAAVAGLARSYGIEMTPLAK